MKTILLCSSILLWTATGAGAGGQPPQDDYLITTESTPLTFTDQDLLANDPYGMGHEITVVIDRYPQSGTFQDEGRQFTYEPDPGFVGEDQLAYLVRIGIETYGPAVVTLKVSPANVPLAGDFDTLQEGLDLGWFDSAEAKFHLCRIQDCRALTTYQAPAALAAMTPFIGDWNADGSEDMGLHDPASGTFYLLVPTIQVMGETPLVIDSQFKLGAGGGTELPVAGDWDGDGTDTVGLYRPGDGRFLLRDTNAPGPYDYEFAFPHFAGAPHPITVKRTTPVGDEVGHWDQATRFLFHRSPMPAARIEKSMDCRNWPIPATPLWAGDRSNGYQLWIYEASMGTVRRCGDNGGVEIYIPPTG